MAQQDIDPSIYLYDEVYDQIKQPVFPDSKQDRQRSRDKPTKSKYIGKMKETNQRRTRDHQRAFERKMKRENQSLNIGEEQVFVTASYLEQKKKEAEERKQEKQEEQEQKKQSAKSKSTTEYRMHVLERHLEAKNRK